MHMVHGDSSDDENSEVYGAEFVWSSSDKPSTCASLKMIPKYQHDEVKYTFDVSKCDRIFDELKRRAYCKIHNTFSHATNDCNIFRRQIQLAINEG